MFNNLKKASNYLIIYIGISILLLLWLYFFHIWPFSPIIPSIEEIHNNSIQQNINLRINNDCTFTWWSSYKKLDIADYTDIINTPSEANNLNSYTKKINISWNISELYFCIISDVRKDYKVKNAYYFDTYVYFWNSENKWHINVGYNTDKWLTYDNSTDKTSPQLNGKFYWHETPFVQILNLDKVTIADTKNWWYKTIRPINLFTRNTSILVWWYVNSYPNYRAWKIIMFRIIYSWWDITLVN